jgi:hypothetical protein
LGDFGFGDFFFDFELLSHQADIVIQIALGDEAVLIERSQGELGRSSPRNMIASDSDLLVFRNFSPFSVARTTR